MVFYQGSEKWEASQWFLNRFADFERMDADLKEYIPNFKYNVFEIASLSEEDVRGAIRLRIYLDAIRMKALRGEEAIREAMVRVTVTIAELPWTEANERFFQVCMIYLFDTMGREYFHQLAELMKTVSEERSEKMQTIADMLRQEGMEKGKEELLWKQITKKFPKIPYTYYEKVKTLRVDQLDILGLELMDMKDPKELDRFL